MVLSTIVFLIIFILTIFYLFTKYKFSYWKNKNVFHVEPTLLFGNLKDVFNEKTTLSIAVDDIYKEARSKGLKFFGIYKFWDPAFVPVDLELIKLILQKDFIHFVDHNALGDEKKDHLSGNLFNLHGSKWKNMRAKLTPAFTSGKLKMMSQEMMKATVSLKKILNNSVISNELIDIKDVLGRFTTDIIGSIGFGIEINSMENPDSEFRKQGLIIVEKMAKQINFVILTVFPSWILRRIGITLTTPENRKFFTNIVEQTVSYREKNNHFRKDFLHLLIQLKNLGKVTNDDETILMSKSGPTIRGLTINEMAAQAFLFFIAGYETSSTTMSFALLELAQNEDIQENLRKEIQRVIQKYDNKLTYDGIMEMEYLEKVILETLRKHPPVSLLPRLCTKDYKIPDTNVIIQAGTTAEIPVLSIHRDPQYYPDPEKFDPERFSNENKASRHPIAYLPFGEGPRICIGLRLGKYQAKVGLCTILSNYRFTLNKKTVLPMKYGPGFVSQIKGGLYLNLKHIK